MLGHIAEQQAAEAARAEQAIAAGGDERALRVPSSVRDYVIQPGDTLLKIARAQMGSEADADILALHNRTVGLLFEDDRLYAGSKLQIPNYEEPAPTSIAEAADDTAS